MKRTFLHFSILAAMSAGLAFAATGGTAASDRAGSAQAVRYVVAFRHGDAERGRDAAIASGLARVALDAGVQARRLRTLGTGAELVEFSGAADPLPLQKALAHESSIAAAAPDEIEVLGADALATLPPTLAVIDTGKRCASSARNAACASLGDVIDASLWTAGVPVAGREVNPQPASVLLLALTEAAQCQLLQPALDKIRAQGATVLVRAGADASAWQACQGVLAGEAGALADIAGVLQQAYALGVVSAPEAAERLLRRHAQGSTAIRQVDLSAAGDAIAAAASSRAVLPIGVTASSHDGNLPGNTLDGNLATRWSAQGDGQWIQYDLGKAVSVDALDIAWHQGDRRSARFDILVGDGESAQLRRVFSGASSGTSAEAERYRFPAATARTLRIVGHGNSVNDWNSIAEVAVQAADIAGPGNDVFGVRMIYPTRSGGETWFMDMANPNADARFDAGDPLVRNTDGSWRFQRDAENAKARLSVRTSAGYDQSQIEDNHAALATRGYMFSPRDWKNVEMTGYVRLNSASSADEFTWYARGGKHSDPKPFCEGVAYKGDLSFSGGVRFAKEPWHVDYHFRPTSHRPAIAPLQGRWVGFKTIMYNVNSNRHVRLELWLDENNNNQWREIDAIRTVDTGGWGDQARRCGATAADQIITWGGPLAVFRWDNVRKVDFRHLSVREISAPAQ